MLIYVLGAVTATLVVYFSALVSAHTTPESAKVRLRMARNRVASLFVLGAIGCSGTAVSGVDGGSGWGGGVTTTTTTTSESDAGDGGGGCAYPGQPCDGGVCTLITNGMLECVPSPSACAGVKDGLLCDLPDGTKGECMSERCVAVPGVCKLNPCIPGSYQSCGPNDGNTACCDGVLPIQVCSVPAGVLVQNCNAPCPSGRCAVSPMGTETCCNPIAGAYDACQTKVP